jgi:hypothetical protein
MRRPKHVQRASIFIGFRSASRFECAAHMSNSTTKPASFMSEQSYCDSGPASRPIRLTFKKAKQTTRSSVGLTRGLGFGHDPASHTNNANLSAFQAHRIMTVDRALDAL